MRRLALENSVVSLCGCYHPSHSALFLAGLFLDKARTALEIGRTEIRSAVLSLRKSVVRKSDVRIRLYGNSEPPERERNVVVATVDLATAVFSVYIQK